MVDVQEAARLVGRHPETVRRWVWAGRLAARRQGNRLLMARADVEAVAASEGTPVMTLAAWAERARALREAVGGRGRARSAADLVLEDRRQRERSLEARAGR